MHNASPEFGSWIPEGFQVRKIRRPRKDVPEWANNDAALRARIVGPSMLRYRIAYLYWRCGWNAREVGEELGISTNAVESTIKRLLKLPVDTASVQTLYEGTSHK